MVVFRMHAKKGLMFRWCARHGCEIRGGGGGGRSRVARTLNACLHKECPITHLRQACTETANNLCSRCQTKVIRSRTGRRMAHTTVTKHPFAFPTLIVNLFGINVTASWIGAIGLQLSLQFRCSMTEALDFFDCCALLIHCRV